MKARTVTLAILGLVFASSAMAKTNDCTPIIAVPYVIVSSGTYCLTRDITAEMATSAAVTITANDVVLDMNGYALDNSTAGSATDAAGIAMSGAQRITVRNGTLRGFAYGINGGAAGGVIENMLIVGSTKWGMYVVTDNLLVRNNRILKTGGSPTFGMSIGIWVAGPNARVLNNEVTDVKHVQAVGVAWGIAVGGNNAVIAGNRVSKVGTGCTGCQSHGIYAAGVTNATIKDNTVSDTQYGIYMANGTARYMGNTVQGVTTPYTGGTPAGNAKH